MGASVDWRCAPIVLNSFRVIGRPRALRKVLEVWGVFRGEPPNNLANPLEFSDAGTRGSAELYPSFPPKLPVTLGSDHRIFVFEEDSQRGASPASLLPC